MIVVFFSNLKVNFKIKYSGLRLIDFFVNNSFRYLSFLKKFDKVNIRIIIRFLIKLVMWIFYK